MADASMYYLERKNDHYGRAVVADTILVTENHRNQIYPTQTYAATSVSTEL